MLILSLFPGIGLLDMAFAEVFGDEGCIVRGPDPLWGGDIRIFHPPAGRFDGVIGGPPCQMFSVMRHLNPNSGSRHGNLIPEFERCVSEAQPEWFLMENVIDAPLPKVDGYLVRDLILNNRWIGGEQNRTRRFSFGTRAGRVLLVEVVLLEVFVFEYCVHGSSNGSKIPVRQNSGGQLKRALKPPTVMAGHGPVGRRAGYEVNLSLSEMCRLQGLPENFLDEAPFTVLGKRKVIGGGVPLPVGRAIARAVKEALAVDGL